MPDFKFKSTLPMSEAESQPRSAYDQLSELAEITTKVMLVLMDIRHYAFEYNAPDSFLSLIDKSLSSLYDSNRYLRHSLSELKSAK